MLLELRVVLFGLKIPNNNPNLKVTDRLPHFPLLLRLIPCRETKQNLQTSIPLLNKRKPLVEAKFRSLKNDGNEHSNDQL